MDYLKMIRSLVPMICEGIMYDVSLQKTSRSPLAAPPILPKNKHGDLASSVKHQARGARGAREGHDRRTIDFIQHHFAICWEERGEKRCSLH